MLVTLSTDGRGLPVTVVLSGGVAVDALAAGSLNGVPVTLVANGVPVQVVSGSLGGGGGGTVTAPVISQRNAPTTNPFTWTTAENATFFPGYYWNVQTATGANAAAAAANLAAGITTASVIQQIEPGDLSGTDPITFAGLTTTSNTGPIALRERVGMEDGLGGYTWGPWSNTLTDTIAAPAVAWTYNNSPSTRSGPFGDPAGLTFANEAFGVGTAVVQVASRGRGAPTGVTIGGVAATLGGQVIGGGGNLNAISTWTAPSASAGNKSVVVAYGNQNAYDICIATGTLGSSINATPTSSVSNAFGFLADPQTSPNFTLPANGVALAIVGTDGTAGPSTWGMGTANAGNSPASDGSFKFATGSTLGGASSATAHFEVSGYNFQGAGLLVVVFGP